MEQRLLVATLRPLAAELADTTGRARAERELETIALELDRVEASLEALELERLDDAAQALAAIETKTALIHSALRTATSRTTAIEIDRLR